MRPRLALQDGVAVGVGAHHPGRADGSAGPNNVLDDKLLSERAREVLTDDADNEITRPAGGERNDDRDWPRRISLRPCDSRHGRQSGSTRYQMHKLTALKRHGVLLWCRSL